MPKIIYSVQIKDDCTLVHDENGYYHLVYKIVNTVNGKFYIGKHSTKDPYDDYMGSGIAINSAIKKYGIENFTKEILFCFTDEKEAYLKEAEIVNLEFINRNDTYNMLVGGNNIAGSWSGEKNPFYGKKHSQETRDKISKNHADVSGKNNPWYGKHPHLSKETREKLSRAKSGNNNPSAKSVLKLDKHGNIITKYETIKDCKNQEHIYREKLVKLIKEHILYNGFYFVIETPKRLF